MIPGNRRSPEIPVFHAAGVILTADFIGVNRSELIIKGTGSINLWGKQYI